MVDYNNTSIITLIFPNAKLVKNKVVISQSTAIKTTELLVLPSNEQRPTDIRCRGRAKNSPPPPRGDETNRDVPKPIGNEVPHLFPYKAMSVCVGLTLLSHAASE